MQGWREPSLRLPLLVAASCFVVIASTAPAQQFTEVTSAVSLINEAKKSWGNPIWGDINNDGLLDLIVPCHGLNASHGPFVYLNSGGISFTDIRTTCGIQMAPELDSTDWHGFAFGDYDGDGNLDLYIAEGAKHGLETKRDLLFRGMGDGTFQYVSDVAGIETSTNRGRAAFWLDYDNDGKLDLFVKNYEGANRLYKNNGNGTLTLVVNAAGLADATLGQDDGSLFSFADYDNDGHMDVAFCGDTTIDIFVQVPGRRHVCRCKRRSTFQTSHQWQRSGLGRLRQRWVSRPLRSQGTSGRSRDYWRDALPQ